MMMTPCYKMNMIRSFPNPPHPSPQALFLCPPGPPLKTHSYWPPAREEQWEVPPCPARKSCWWWWRRWTGTLQLPRHKYLPWRRNRYVCILGNDILMVGGAKCNQFMSNNNLPSFVWVTVEGNPIPLSDCVVTYVSWWSNSIGLYILTFYWMQAELEETARTAASTPHSSAFSSAPSPTTPSTDSAPMTAEDTPLPSPSPSNRPSPKKSQMDIIYSDNRVNMLSVDGFIKITNFVSIDRWNQDLPRALFHPSAFPCYRVWL